MQRSETIMHLIWVNQTELTMHKRLIIIAAALLASAAAVSGQTFERHNRWIVGGDIIKSVYHDIGAGVSGIYGRQYSETIFLGVGFGMNTHMAKRGTSTVTFTDNDGNTVVRTRLPYNWSVAVPVYADLQIDFSSRRSPFYAEVKAGGIVTCEIERVRGTESYNNLEWTPFGETGILLGLHIGKRFALAKGGEINLSLGGDCIMGWGIDFPVSLGVSYGF